MYVYVFLVKQKTAYEVLRSLVGSEKWIRDRSTLNMDDVRGNRGGVAK